MKVFADSLKELIENGADFAQLAMTNSMDGAAENGGDLGTFAEGQMVTEFNDACFEGNTGDVMVVETQFGQHIIEIVDQGPEVKKVKVAVMSRRVEPSSTTYQAQYSRAIEFAGKGLIDIGQFASEYLVVETFAQRLKERLMSAGRIVQVEPCRLEKDPFVII